MQTDWRAGFLFVGNHLSLDFLNTKPVLDAGPTELLPDCAALASWLAAAGLISSSKSNRLAKSWSKDPARTKQLNELLQFRENLRRAVLEMEAGSQPSQAFVAEVNRHLSSHPYREKLVDANRSLVRINSFDPQEPLDLFAPLAADVAALLTLPDAARLRKCRTCVLHFLDTSKKGTRAWCSMNMCGNRSKVAAYARRNR